MTEGQDDVLCYKKIFEKFNYTSKASFFGWGAVGASKIKCILDILSNLGYVFTILDNDRREIISKLKKEYKNYDFFAIAANDVRNKNRDNKIDTLIKEIDKMELDMNIKNRILNLINNKFENKIGLIKSMSTYEINHEYEENINELISSIKNYFYKEKFIKKKSINDDCEIIERNKAQKLQDEWLRKNKIYECIQKNTKSLSFI